MSNKYVYISRLNMIEVISSMGLPFNNIVLLENFLSGCWYSNCGIVSGTFGLISRFANGYNYDYMEDSKFPLSINCTVTLTNETGHNEIVRNDTSVFKEGTRLEEHVGDFMEVNVGFRDIELMEELREDLEIYLKAIEYLLFKDVKVDDFDTIDFNLHSGHDKCIVMAYKVI